MKLLSVITRHCFINRLQKRGLSSIMPDRPLESAIRSKLLDKLGPTHLEVINESYMHNVPASAETHFKVVVVSDKFENVPLIQRHRLVNEILDHELKNGIHALSIMAKTPIQWEKSDKTVAPSPNCRGGFGK
nr:bolA-like protein DDB_G0274169 isoform X1 [Halyomorpha halys]